MKKLYLQARAARLAKEREIEKIALHSRESSEAHFTSVRDLIMKQNYLNFLEDSLRAEQAALALCEQEEDAAKSEWLAAKRELQSMEKLYELDLQAHTLKLQRAEQNEMDELALMRRAS